MLTDEQKRIRRSGVTATDIAAILGKHPYKSAVDVLLAKTGEAPDDDEESERAKWGQILEDPIRRDYADRHGVRVTVPGTLRHPKISTHLATPDGIVFPNVAGVTDPERGHEIKTHTVHYAHLYGEPGSDEVPMWELFQCVWNMHVTGLELWDLTAFLDGLPADYTIDRDDELIEIMVDAADRFWIDHVEGGKPIPPDGSKAYEEHLRRLYPKHTETIVELTPDDAETLATIESLYMLRSEIRSKEDLEAMLVQDIKLAIGDAAGIEFPAIKGTGKAKKQRITWKLCKDSTGTDWKAIAEYLKERIAVFSELAQEGKVEDAAALLMTIPTWDKLIAGHEKITKKGSRRFNVPRAWNQ